MTEHEDVKTCCSGGKKHGHKQMLAGLIILCTLVNLLGGYYFSTRVSNAYLQLEYDKVGGKDNYDLVSKANLIQLQGQLSQIKSYVDANKDKLPSTADTSAATQTNSTSADTSASSGSVAATPTLTKDQITKIEQGAGAYITGSTSARFTLVEYSDLECPFCIRMYRDKTIEQVQAKYGTEVNFIFKTFRAVPHQNAQIEAQANICAGKLGGAKAYYAYFNAVESRTNPEKFGQGVGFPADGLVPLAKELGLNTTKFQACTKDTATTNEYDANTTEGTTLFQIQGTPGTVVIDNQTGKYTLIAGAYPVDTFFSTIEALKAAK